MKKILAMVLACSLLLSACGQSTAPQSTGSEEPAIDNPQTPAPSMVSAEEPEEYTFREIVPEFNNLDDEALLRYMEDQVYAGFLSAMDSEDYFLENVSAVYVSKEYLEELSYNSKENIFFGYTISELDQQFQGTRYVFTLGDNGETTVEPFEEYTDVYGQVIKNVAIGSGVILVCVTVSAVTGGAGAPAVSMILAASAKTGSIMALASGAIGGVSAGIVTGIQTKDFGQAMEAAALAGSEGFKWGAISGVISGGASEAIALKGATLNGLTMNEAAAIQKESGYPLDVIKQLHTMDEYQVFKKANLKPVVVGNNTALIKTDIDLTRVDAKGRTNLERMKQGLAPQDSNGISYELHHVGQKKDGTLAILSQVEHDDPAIHGFLQKTEAHATGTNWDAERQAFWKSFAELII